jgi:hypothetical protein
MLDALVPHLLDRKWTGSASTIAPRHLSANHIG